jgi:uncharacterized protein (TIGR00369 family)
MPVGPWDPTRLPPIQGDEEAVKSFTGSPPPVGRLMTARIAELWRDRAVFCSFPNEWLVGPRGVMPLGVMAVFMDAALGLAAIAGEGGLYSSTVTLELHALGRPAAGALETRSEGRPVGVDGAMAISSATMADGAGSVLVHGSARNILMPRPDMAFPDATAAPGTTVDPCDLPVQGEPIPLEVWAELGAAETLRRQMAGALPLSPIEELTGLRLASMADGKAVSSVPASVWLSNPAVVVQGGVFVLLMEAAAEAAVASVLDGPGDVRALDVRVNYLRPAPADGSDLEARAVVLHAGRTMAVVTADVVRADGKPAGTALATVEIAAPLAR